MSLRPIKGILSGVFPTKIVIPLFGGELDGDNPLS
jgi:hypothetical protein